MKTLFRPVIAEFLAILARAILEKYKPKIVMVTGSVGKTSTKDAVATSLSERYFLRASEKSYNSEFGVPLTIIGVPNPWSSIPAWLHVFQEAFSLIFLPAHYPKLLVLEVGADRPGDLQHILHIATPDAVVVTCLPDVPVHVEAYASAEAVREEEFTPAYALSKDAPLVISADDENAKRLARRLQVHLSTFGRAPDASVRVTDIRVQEKKGKIVGMEATVTVNGAVHTLRAEGALGQSQMYAPAAALALALALGVSVKDALKGLEKYVPPPGRARLLEGKNDSILIDDSYNASPTAVEAILESLVQVPAKRRVVILGDMLELGRYSVSEHQRIGTLASQKADVVIAVGTRARALAESARLASDTEVLAFADSNSAREALSDFLQPGDVVLIKGSQSIRLERVVEALLRNPKDVSELVRQDAEWLNKA